MTTADLLNENINDVCFFDYAKRQIEVCKEQGYTKEVFIEILFKSNFYKLKEKATKVVSSFEKAKEIDTQFLVDDCKKGILIDDYKKGELMVDLVAKYGRDSTYLRRMLIEVLGANEYEHIKIVRSINRRKEKEKTFKNRFVLR